MFSKLGVKSYQGYLLILVVSIFFIFLFSKREVCLSFDREIFFKNNVSLVGGATISYDETQYMRIRTNKQPVFLSLAEQPAFLSLNHWSDYSGIKLHVAPESKPSNVSIFWTNASENEKEMTVTIPAFLKVVEQEIKKEWKQNNNQSIGLFSLKIPAETTFTINKLCVTSRWFS